MSRIIYKVDVIQGPCADIYRLLFTQLVFSKEDLDMLLDVYPSSKYEEIEVDDSVLETKLICELTNEECDKICQKYSGKENGVVCKGCPFNNMDCYLVGFQRNYRGRIRIKEHLE